MEKTVKVLKAEMFEQVIEVLKAQEDVNEALVEFVQTELDRHIVRQEKAKERAAKKRAQSDALVDVVYAAIEAIEGFATRDEITAKVEEMYDGDIEITAPKIGARITKLVADGKVEKTQKTVNKARKMFYAIAGTVDEVEDFEE